jgi:hypothetical protein
MKKTQLILILLVITTSFESQIDCRMISKDLLRPPSIILRSFNIFPVKMLQDLQKTQGLQEKIQKDKERLEFLLSNERDLKKETKRRRMFQEFFEKHPLYSKSFLNDFHTNRFF